MAIQQDGTTYTATKNIAEAFAGYYADFYKARTLEEGPQICEYLSAIDTPTLSVDDRALLDKELTREDVLTAIGKQKLGKTQGPNGLPAEFFKANASLLGPHLLKMYLAALAEGTLPTDLCNATVVVIHKQGKHASDCGAYRHISLLNVETKILATILATRLLLVITSLIYCDKSGLMPKRATRFNLRRLARYSANIGLPILDYQRI